MTTKLDQEFIFQILAIVEEIPQGYVVTYGQLAQLSGHPKNARLAGRVLSLSQYYGQYPCHRVVNSSGKTAPGWPEQKGFLEKEGVSFKLNGCVDLKRHQWKTV